MQRAKTLWRGLYLVMLLLFVTLTGLVVYNRLAAQSPIAAEERASRQDSDAIRVSTAAELRRVLRDRAGGFTVLLAPGNYGRVRLVAEPGETSFAQPVTIRSADPCNRARFGHLTVKGFVNITLQDLRFENPSFFARPREEVLKPDGRIRHLDLLRTDNVEAITIRDNIFTGPTVRMAGANRPDEGYGYGFGWKGLGLRDAVFTGNELTNLYKAISLGNSDGLEISGNSMHDYRSDAIYLGKVKRLLISNNYMANPRPFLLPKGVGDHPDFIQIEEPDGAVIENNYMDVGPVAEISQGIYSRPARDLVVRNNVIVTRGVNAIFIVALEDGQIVNNLVVDAGPPRGAMPDQRWTIHQPLLRIKDNFRNVEVTGNVASKYNHDFERVARSAGVSASGNILAQNARPGAPGYYRYASFDGPAPDGMISIGNVRVATLPPGIGPDPAKFGYLSQIRARTAEACRR